MAGEREGVDYPDKRVKAIFPKLAIAFCSTRIKVFHPPRAEHIEGYEEMNPHDFKRIGIPGDGLWIKNMIDARIKWYRVANFLWKEGTGGGPGDPENYCNWEDQDTEQCQNYNNKGQEGLLAWIYMHDKDLGFCFTPKVLISR